MKAALTLFAFAFITQNVYSQSATGDTTITIKAHASLKIPFPKGERWLIGTNAYNCIRFEESGESLEIISLCNETQQVELKSVSIEVYEQIMHPVVKGHPSVDIDYPLLDVPRPKSE